MTKCSVRLWFPCAATSPAFPHRTISDLSHGTWTHHEACSKLRDTSCLLTPILIRHPQVTSANQQLCLLRLPWQVGRMRLTGPTLRPFCQCYQSLLCVCAFSPHTSIFASIPTVLHSDETQQQCHQFSFSHFWFLWKCSFWSHWITNLKKVCQWAKNHRESVAETKHKWGYYSLNYCELIRVRMVGYQCCCTVLVWFFAVMFSPLFQEN